jgi:hypothetical protein
MILACMDNRRHPPTFRSHEKRIGYRAGTFDEPAQDSAPKYPSAGSAVILSSMWELTPEC